MAKLGDLTIGVGVNTSQLKKGLSKAESRLKSASRKMKSIGGTLTTNVTAPLVAAGGIVSKFSSDFQSKVNEVGGAADLTAKQMEKVGDAAEKIAGKTGKSTDTILNSFKTAMRAGLDFRDAQKLVTQSTKAYASGIGEAGENTRVAAKTIKLFGKSAGGPKKVMDRLAAASQTTGAKMDRLNDAYSEAIGPASRFGASQKQVLGIVATLSDKMADTEAVGGGLAEVFRGIKKPTKGARKAFKKLFGSTNKFQKLAKQDTAAALKKLKKRLNEAGMSMDQVFQNDQAKEAVNALVSSGRELQKTLKKVGASTGKVNNQFKQTAGPSRALAKAWRKTKTALRPLGKAVLKAVVPALKSVTPLIKDLSEWFQDLSPTTKKWMVAISGLAAVLGPIIGTLGSIVGGISSLITVVTTVAGFVSSTLLPALGSLAAILSGPVVAAIAAAATVGVIIANWEEVKEFFSGLGEAIVDTIKFAFGLVEAVIKGAAQVAGAVWKGAKSVLSSIASGIKDFFVGAWETIKEVAKSVWSRIKSIIMAPINVIKDAWGALKEGISSIISGIANTIKSTWKSIKSTAASFWIGIKRIVMKPIEEIKEAWEWLKKVLVGSSIVPEMTDQIETEFEEMGDSVEDTTSLALERTSRTFGNFLGGMKDNAEALGVKLEDTREEMQLLIEKAQGAPQVQKGHKTQVNFPGFGPFGRAVGGGNAIGQGLGLLGPLPKAVPIRGGRVKRRQQQLFGPVHAVGQGGGVGAFKKQFGAGGQAGAGSVFGFGGSTSAFGFASGGVISAGQTALVGEEGPELIRPTRSTRVIPNDEIGEAGGDNINVTVNYNPGEDSAADRERLKKEIIEAVREGKARAKVT